MKKVLFFSLLFLLTGCMTRQSVLSIVEEHHTSVVVPVLEEQATSIEVQNKQITIAKVRIDENTYQILELNKQVTLHKDLLIETFEQQRDLAETAIERLQPSVKPVTDPVSTNEVEQVEETPPVK